MIKPELQKLCEKLNYTFTQPVLLKTALTHRSHSATHNERLEFLGDSILNFVIAEALCTRHAKASEGELSRLRSHLVQGSTLAEIAKTVDLGHFLKLGFGELKTGGTERESTLADALEAIIAAIFLDSNFDTCKQFILHLFKDRLENASLTNTKDPKTKLQEYLQYHKHTLPIYELITTEGELHNQTFKIRCKIKGSKEETFGISTNRRKAEQEAAKAFLKKLGQT